MKPIKLTMEAFGSYRNKTVIDFTKTNQNLFLITGDTGAGKTTIFDALVFALYGEASSSANKKDGMELQSQFAGLEVEPFVELEFSVGARRDRYTVRRIPRHQRPLKRGRGIKEESGTVSLLMPDGAEYPQKETDRKLEEIVGLTKSQFMQVAMIAQGEFMEMLRAKSDDKKVVFRKLFNTKFFQDIAEELFRRKKSREKEVETIRIVFQTEAAHVAVPENYGRAGEWQSVRQRIEKAGKPTITDMEALLDELRLLCEALEADRDRAREAFAQASAHRDEMADACTKAEELLKFFDQLEKAAEELAWCRENEKEVEEARALITGLRSAYSIRAEYQLYESALKQTMATRTKLEKQQKLLPELERAEQKTVADEIEAGKLYEQELEICSRIEDRVKRALELFEKVEKARKEEADAQAALDEAKEAARTEADRLGALEKQEKEWREQSERLAGAEKGLTLWKVKDDAADGLAREAEAVCKAQKNIEEQRKKAGQAKKDYVLAGAIYEKENSCYEEMRTAFLDEQAGFLAGELKAGEPCPVCGSREHPNPCGRTEIHEELSREVVDNMAETVNELRARQEKLAAEARSRGDILAESERRFKEDTEKLYRQMEEWDDLLVISSEMTPGEAKKLLDHGKQRIQAEGKQLESDVQTYRKLQDSLRTVDQEKEKLQTAVEQTRERMAAAAGVWEAKRAALNALEQGKEYPSETDARQAGLAARQARDEKNAAHQAAKKAAKDAKSGKESAETLVRQYSRELPVQEEQCRRRRDAYEAVMARKAMAEKAWMALVKEYDSEEADRRQNTVDSYNKKKASAEQMQASAREAIGGREKPALADRQREKDEAEEKRNAAQETLRQCEACYRAADNARKAMAPKMPERKKAVEEHAKLDTLYRLVSGNVKGSRMDLETYVQRYYLEKILHAANRRFRDMSAGQFELRMCDLKKAGEGKNRGLDLMVHSTVTGKEREIRTLSGGESFMAALSLSLGMADQICETSAAISLDIMFIDEGFGSLDEHSRSQAVRVLQEMAGGSRLVGIISHVTELKQEIDDQLIVRKDEEGSHVRWQIS